MIAQLLGKMRKIVTSRPEIWQFLVPCGKDSISRNGFLQPDAASSFPRISCKYTCTQVDMESPGRKKVRPPLLFWQGHTGGKGLRRDERCDETRTFRIPKVVRLSI